MLISDFAIRRPTTPVGAVPALLGGGHMELPKLQPGEFPDVSPPHIPVSHAPPGEKTSLADLKARCVQLRLCRANEIKRVALSDRQQRTAVTVNLTRRTDVPGCGEPAQHPPPLRPPARLLC